MKCKIFIILLTCIILSFSGCKEAGIISNVSELSSTSQTSKNDESSSTSQSTSSELKLEKWQVAYAELLKDVYKNDNSKYDYLVFFLRDMDNDGVPEIIIDRRNDEGQKSVLAVYSYDGNVYKIGEIDNPSSYASALCFSNNPLFPGLFWLRYGGGIERYGYLSIKNRKLVSEHLWNMDNTKENSQQIKFSDNKKLINESNEIFNDAYNGSDEPNNVIETHTINENNIVEIAKWSH